MADNKKSVLLYCDIIHTVKPLSDEEAGKLFKHYLMYINDENPEPCDRLTCLLFEPIKQNLKRDLKKWEAKSLKNKENAKIRWNANAYERTNPDANHADNVTVKDKDKDKVTVKDNNRFSAIAFMCFLGYEEKLVLEWFEVRKFKKLKNTETALKSFNEEVIKSGYPINDVLKICVEKSWGGFKISWLDDKKFKPPENTGKLEKALSINEQLKQEIIQRYESINNNR